MLKDIDKKVEESRERHFEALAGLMARGVQIVPHHHMMDGSVAVLLSPRDYSRLKEYMKDG